MNRSESIEELAETAGLRHLHVITWRDLDHPDAGGSELHVNRLAQQWAGAGIEVTLHTASVPNQITNIERDGYGVIRRGTPLSVLVRNPLGVRIARTQPGTGLVEVWHGINFLAPLWASMPRIAIAHHVHGKQFRQVLPGLVGRVAEQLEHRVYPRLYRDTDIVTLSASSKCELVELSYRTEKVHIASPGIDPDFNADRSIPRFDVPTLVTVARLMPQKHLDVVIHCASELREEFPNLKLIIIGDGPERERLEALVHERELSQTVTFTGRVDHRSLIDYYRRSWLVVSASTAEGWGMTITEAAACGTPSVATRIAGHVDAISDGQSGLLAETTDELTGHIRAVLRDKPLREHLALGAIEHARTFTWPECAKRTLAPLVTQMQYQRFKG